MPRITSSTRLFVAEIIVPHSRVREHLQGPAFVPSQKVQESRAGNKIISTFVRSKDPRILQGAEVAAATGGAGFSADAPRAAEQVFDIPSGPPPRPRSEPEEEFKNSPPKISVATFSQG